MELVICLGVAISAFILIILAVVGLISAPTPILLGILIFGFIITQKSIDSLAEPEFSVMEEKDKVELLHNNILTKNPKDTGKSMVYRGSHYISTTNVNSISQAHKSQRLKYRGVELTNQ